MFKGFYRNYGKRMFDLAIAIPMMIALAPIVVITAIMVRIKFGSPILFRQERPGYREKLFRICKFRTMTDARGADGKLLSDEIRLTKFGKFLRDSSLDEFPEIWNVIVGQMSFVGPRPLRTHYLPLYSPEQSRRHNVMPGITGWAQVNGRNSISWEERFELDVWYVDNISFLLDLNILWKTAATVISRKDIDAEGHISMPHFAGSNSGDGSTNPSGHAVEYEDTRRAA